MLTHGADPGLSRVSDVLNLHVTYTPTYPDELPLLEIECEQGELSEDERERLLNGLRGVGEDNLGMVRTRSRVARPPSPFRCYGVARAQGDQSPPGSRSRQLTDLLLDIGHGVYIVSVLARRIGRCLGRQKAETGRGRR